MTTAEPTHEAAERRARGAGTRARRPSRAGKALVDGAIVAKRNLIKIKRVPDLLVFSTISPIMFILLFAYVFGSAIQRRPGISYKRVPDPGHLRPDGDLRRHDHRRRAWPTTSRRASSTGSGRCRCRASAVLVGRTDQRRAQQRPGHRRSCR